jgi:MFS family permease
MGAKCALPSVFSQLTSPRIGLSFAGWTSTPQSLMANQLALSTCAVALGKLLLGPLIDNFGGVLALQACLSTLMVMLTTISLANNFITFAIAWIIVDFVFSSCWAACINAVHQSFPETEWAKLIGIIAAGARTGNASAFFMFAGILQWSNKHLLPDAQAWRLVFGASAVLQLIPIALLSYFGTMTSNNSDHSDINPNRGKTAHPKEVRSDDHQSIAENLTGNRQLLPSSGCTLCLARR